MMKRGLLCLVCLSLASSSWAAFDITISSAVIISTEPLDTDVYLINFSTPTPGQLKQMRRFRPRRRPLQQLQDMPMRIQREIKKTSPNPNVQSPGTSAMPANSPEMPHGPSMPTVPSKADRFFGAVSKVMVKSWGDNIFVWLPAISTDPNSGPTIGVLPVMVLADKATHHIRHLFAPSYTYNELFGQTGTWRYYYYPTDSSQLFTTASLSHHTNREVKARYENTAARDGVLYIRAESYYTANGSNRFFGIGNATHQGDESGYVSKDGVARVDLGINFAHYWRTTFNARFRRLETDNNIIPHTANLLTRFPNTPGVGTNTTIAQGIRILWDTRDSPVTPSKGTSGEFFGEKTSEAMGSDSDFIRYGLEGKRFFLWKDHPHQVTVVRGLYQKVNGSFIPFYELSQLGGRDSLRGYGEGRFADRGSLVFNVEQRFTFASLNLMNIQTNFEVAPFVDLGTVFPDIQDIKSKSLRPVYGAAFRAAVKPNVVGDVEVGIGREGPAVFVDINYPY